MFGKILIKGTLEVVTGLHIGGSSQFSAIGAVDSPIIRDPVSDLPIIPGSSLKGKMRSLLARSASKTPIRIEEEPVEIARLFGCAKSDSLKFGRLIFSDLVLGNKKALENLGAKSVTEVKFENAINRLSGVANPRQIERSIRGSEFPLELIYNVEDSEEILDDFEKIREGFKLLQYDYLGGSGTRGYGKVNFKELEVEVVVGEVASATIDECNKLMKDV